MAAIKHTLQRQVFLPSEERLIAVVHVTKVGKKKKASFLCAAVTQEKPIEALIYQVKKSEKGDNNFKKKLAWALRELKILDAKDDTKDTAEFDMQFDKTYKWIASSIAEKNSFIQCLWKLSQRYVVQKPEYINVPPGVLEDLNQSSEADQSVQQAEELAMAVDSDYQALTQREETDLETLMNQCDYAVSNAEAFAEQLTKELSVLDGANIHSIMGSEDQVLELMGLIDEALAEATVVEDKLEEYDHRLQAVKDLMEIMKNKDSQMQIRNNNHQHLLETLDGIVSNLDLEHKHVKALLDGDLMTPHGINECSTAAHALQKCMQAQIHHSLEKMAAVQEQRKRFNRLKTTFTKRLSHQLNNLFIHQGNDPGETLGRYSQELKLPQHLSSHQDLLPYADLMLWLKQADPEIFTKLSKVYTSSLSKLYDREVKEFMEASKQKVAPRLERKVPETDSPPARNSSSAFKSYLTTPSPGQESPKGSFRSYIDNRKYGTLPTAQRHIQQGSTSSLNKMFDARKSSSQTTLDSDSQHGSDPDIIGRTKMDQMFEHVLSELGPWCLAEQDFCVKFFHLTSDQEKEQDDKTDGQEQSEEGPWVPRKPSNVKERQINEEVRRMMIELFPSLETELTTFIQFGDRLDNFNSLYMLVRMSEHVINAEDTGSYLSKTFASCLVHVKRNFDRFIIAQIEAIGESKLHKRSRVGIIPFVHSFEEFAQQAETIFKGSDRRTDLDKAYQRVVTKIFDQIQRVASESQKTPSDVVKMENYHHMYAALSHLRIPSLDAQRKEAKSRYQDYLHAYVSTSLGRPMEKLSVFFEGVEAKVAQGVKQEEVGYQLAFSKQELRKHIREYPGKEVKKNLEHLYKKVEKHLCEEENLLQVLWHYMQDEFLKQYKHFDQLITKCYPESGISLEFTISDLLTYFSDIAQSH